MKDKFNNKKGNTLIELIMVMMLLALLGITIFTLIFMGAETESKIIRQKDSQIDARIALSYVNVRIRQNDMKDRIHVATNPINGENAILIKDLVGAEGNDLWIFWHEGKLYECLITSNEAPSINQSLPIVDIEGFKTDFDSELGFIKNSIIFDYNGESKNISSTVHLRSY